ncbi:MAG: ERF family protein [Firmicutes bacterium]|nr:ERF family protein [Bacillota bacterium]
MTNQEAAFEYMSHITIPIKLAKKLAQIMSALARIPKNGYNRHFDYKYVMEADVTDTLRTLLAEHGVVVLSTIESIEQKVEPSTDGKKPSTTTTVWVDFTLVDSDSGEHWTSRYPGQGSDSTDKGIPKALTAATKYFLLKTFMLSSGDDPENDGKPDNRGDNGRSGSGQQGSGRSGGSKPTLPDLPATAIAIRVTEGSLTSKNSNGKSVMLFKGKAVYEETGETFPVSGWREQGQFLNLSKEQSRPVVVTLEKSERFGEYQAKSAAWPEGDAKSSETGATKGNASPAAPKAEQGAEPKLAFRQEVSRLRNAGVQDGQISEVVNLCTGGATFDDSPDHIQDFVVFVLKFLPDRFDGVKAALKGKPIHTWGADQLPGFRTYLTNHFKDQQTPAPVSDSSDVVQL